MANEVQDPRDALEIFKKAVVNYGNANDDKNQNIALADAAEKFTAKGIEIHKTQKTLVLALDSFTQAAKIGKTTSSSWRATRAL